MDNNVGWVENKPLSEQQQLKEDRQKNLCVAVTGGGTSTGIARNSCRYITIKYGKGSHCGEQCYHNI